MHSLFKSLNEFLGMCCKSFKKMYKEKIKISYGFIKKNVNVFFLYIVIMTVFFVISRIFTPDAIKRDLSFTEYLKLLFIDYYIPEFFTCVSLTYLTRKFQERIKSSIYLSIKSIFLYELKFIPFILVVYIFYAPLTITFRYVLLEIPNLNFSEYYNNYLIGGLFNWKVYSKYVIFSGMFVYILTNISLIEDIWFKRYEYQVIPNASDDKITDELETTKIVSLPIYKDYQTSIRGKDNRGDIIFPVDECLWFETSGGSGDYYVAHPKGKFKITNSLNELEDDLDPKIFFRVNRKQIINLHFLKTFAYWQSGKYILRVDTKTEIVEFVMARARLNDLKKRLSMKK